MPEDPFDERVAPFGQFVVALSIAAAPTGDPMLDATMHVERLELELPCELQVLQAPDGALTIGGSAPTQRVETTVMPVFHRVAVTVVRQPGAAEAVDG